MVKAHTAQAGQYFVINGGHHFINSVQVQGNGSGLVIIETATAGTFTQQASDLIVVR